MSFGVRVTSNPEVMQGEPARAVYRAFRENKRRRHAFIRSFWDDRTMNLLHRHDLCLGQFDGRGGCAFCSHKLVLCRIQGGGALSSLVP
jgi:hypothetical protein